MPTFVDTPREVIHQYRFFGIYVGRLHNCTRFFLVIFSGKVLANEQRGEKMELRIPGLSVYAPHDILYRLRLSTFGTASGRYRLLCAHAQTATTRPRRVEAWLESYSYMKIIPAQTSCPPAVGPPKPNLGATGWHVLHVCVGIYNGGLPLQRSIFLLAVLRPQLHLSRQCCQRHRLF